MNKLKKILASILCLNILLSSSPVLLFAADTTNITGVTGNNGVYNITAQEVVSGTGYRQYTDFTLANSDIANLIFTKDNANFSRFINMVDNKVEINGLLNSMDGNGAFYNGHAIFVTPSGMVIGKDGILNVGKLSLISTTNSAYNSYIKNRSESNFDSLITNSSGDIIINGRVLTSVSAEKAAEIYAENIIVERKATSTEELVEDSIGVAANTDTTDNRIYNSSATATEKFNSLVNAQVKAATNTEFDAQGNVILTNTKLDASGSVTINNEVAFKATEIRFFGGFEVGKEKILDFGSAVVEPAINRNVSDTILLDNSTISGKKVNVSAISTAYGETDLAFGTGSTWSILWDMLENGLTSVGELISNVTFNYFSGARSLSEVVIKNNSNISASDELNIGTKANATFNLENKPKEMDNKAIQDFLFTFGTQTKSKITVENSKIYSEGKASITAESFNSFGKKNDLIDPVLRTGGLLSFKEGMTGMFNLSFFNFSTIVDTGVIVKNSTVTGSENSINTDATVQNDIGIVMSDTVARAAKEMTDEQIKQCGGNIGNGAVVSVLVNNVDLKNKVDIINSTVEAEEGDVSIKASTSETNTIRNTVSTKAGKAANPVVVDDNTLSPLLPLAYFRSFYNQAGRTGEKKQEIQHILSTLLTAGMDYAFSLAADKLAEVLPRDVFKVGGVTTFNSLKNDQEISFSNSKIISYKNIVVDSQLEVIHSNLTVGEAIKGSDKSTVGIGAAFIYDSVNDDNIVNITDNSELNAGSDIAVNAFTDVPGSGDTGTIIIGPGNNLLTLNISFDTDEWKFEKFKVKNKKLPSWLNKEDVLDAKKWIPALRVVGLFENQVASFSETKDGEIDLAVSALVALKNNNTKVNIQNSTLKSKDGNVRIDAANRVKVYTAIGIRELIVNVDNYKTLKDFYNTDGLGGDFFYNGSENNAIVTIDKSTITANNGDVNLGSATDQLHLNLLKTGAKVNSSIGIAGSVFVQNFDGETSVNVTDAEAKGKNVNIAAGQAGKLNDRLIAVDINGAYSENTAGGLAFGAAVNVWTLGKTVNALVDRSLITSTAGDTYINSSTENNLIDFSLAGSFSENESKKGAAAVAGNENGAVNNAVNRANEAGANNQNVQVQEDAEEGGAGDAANAANDVGKKENRIQFSLAGSGSVIVVVDDSDVTADVKDSTIDSSGKTDINASIENFTVLGSGAIAGSTKVGVGAAANLYLRDDSDNVVRASVENTKVVSGGAVSVKAKDTSDVYSFAVGVGKISEDPQSSESATISFGGSFDFNTVMPTVDAHISDNSRIEGKSGSEKADVTVDAQASTFTLSASGGLTFDKAPGLSIGASIAATADRMASNIVSYISDSVLDTNIGKVSVLSGASNTTYGVGVSTAVTTKATTDYKFDGSLGIVLYDNSIKSEVKNSKINADDDVEVHADNSSESMNLEGTAQFTFESSNGFGVNGAAIANKQSNKVSSVIDSKSTISSLGSINALANSREELSAIPITASIAKTGMKSLSNVIVHIVKNNVTTEVSGTLKSGKDVTLAANDDTYLLTRGGTVGIDSAPKSETLDLILDFSVNYNKIAKTVDTSVVGATINADGDFSVSATAVDAIGASDGKKDEDELLVKDADGYYSDLDVEKDFLKWNMLYSLGLAKDSGGTAAGTVIVDKVKNNVNASVGARYLIDSIVPTTIKARNASVFAADNAINNVLAGSVTGTAGKKAVAVGFQAIWSNNASKVRALVIQNTNLTAEGKTEIKAVSDKDTNLVLVAAAGSKGKGVSLAANGIYNSQEDNVYAGVDYSTIETGSLNVNADNKEDEVKVMVGLSGSTEAVALSVEPLLNNQKSKVRSFINMDGLATSDENLELYFDPYRKNTLFKKVDNNHTSSVLTKKEGLSVKANNSIDTTDVIVAISGAKHVAGSGLGIVQTFNDFVSSNVVLAVIDSAGGFEASALNKFNIDNWSMGASGAYQGAGVIANVVYNEIDSVTRVTVSGNDIRTVGDVKVNLTVDENLANNVASLDGTYIGGSVGLNLIFNSFVEDSGIEMLGNNFHVEDREVSAFVKSAVNRVLANRTILGSLNIFGGAVNGAGVKTKKRSSTTALFESNFNSKGDLNVSAEDNTSTSEISVNVAAGAVGGGIGVNVFVFSDKGTALASVKRNITARNVNVDSKVKQAYNQVNVGVDTGIGVIGVNVAKVRLGNTDVPVYTPTPDIYEKYEQTATEQLYSKFGKKVYDDETPEVTGAVALVGDKTGLTTNTINASGNVKVNAETDIEKVNLTNVNVTAAGGDVGVGVHSVALKHSTAAGIWGSSVNAGNVEVSASQKDRADLDSVGVEIAVAKIGVGANSYSNESNTTAEIYKSSINTQNGAVSVLSSTDTEASSSNVDVSLTGVDVNVLSHKVVDSAKANSLITGASTINADTLNLRSSGAMDISGSSTAVKISVIPIDVNSNKVEGSAEISALIKDADGTAINVNNLNIVTDYSKMKVTAKNNVVDLEGLDVSVYKDNATLKTVFNSGINSEGSVVINNKGTTLIETAKPTDTENELLTVKASIGGVNISILTPYGGVTANAKNDAKSNSFVNASNHNAANLVINAYLKTKVEATADSNNFGAVGIDFAGSKGTNTSTLNITTGGLSNITEKIQFNAQNVAYSDVDLDSIGVGLLAEISNMKLKSEMDANTTTNLSGTMNAKSVEGNFNTERTGKLSSAYNGGGAISVANMTGTNKIGGNSDILMKGLTVNANSFTLNNISNNTTDDVSKSSTGGLFEFGGGDYTNEFSTNSKIRVEHNSELNATEKLDLIARNNNIVKDSSRESGGGFIAFKSNDYDRKFTAATEVKVDSSAISVGVFDQYKNPVTAGDLTISATSDIRTDKEEVVKYSASGDGFIVGNEVNLKTTLNQTNSVNISGASKIDVAGSTGIITASSFFYKQYVASENDGFMAWPEAKSKLTSNNTNNVTLNEMSYVKTAKELTISFDANGDLYTKTFAKGRNFGSKVKSTADIALTVNNNFNVGDQESTVTDDFNKNQFYGGNVVNIAFMGNSVTNVDHESYAQCNAFIPDTSQDGTSKKTVNNTFNLYGNGSLQTKNEVSVDFSFGDGEVKSWNHYKRVYYSWFGKTKTKDYRHNVELYHNPVFNMTGAITAGLADVWVLEIDSDENIVKSIGFKSSSYEFIDAKDAQDLKNQRVSLIRSELGDAEFQHGISKIFRDAQEVLINLVLDEINIFDRVSTDPNIQEKVIGDLRTQIKNEQRELFATDYSKRSGCTIEEARAQFDAIIEAYIESREHETDFDFDEMDNYIEKHVSDSSFKASYEHSRDVIDERLYVATVTAVVEDPQNNDTIQLVYYNNGSEFFAIYGEGTVGKTTAEALNNAKENLGSELKNCQDRLGEMDADLKKQEAKIANIQQRLATAEGTSPEEYEAKYGLYSIVFENINLTSQGTIKINGVAESAEGAPDADYPASLDPSTNTGTLRIKGPGSYEKLQFYVGTGGLEIINHSNRSLMFSDVTITGNTREDKLVINEKIRNDLIKDSSSPYLITGITLVNDLDVTHPFYTNNTGHELKDLNNIVVNGLLSTDSENDKIIINSQSGDVRISSINYIANRKVQISAEQGNLIIGGHKDTDHVTRFTLDAGNFLVAGKLLKINADEININGNLSAGTVRKIFSFSAQTPELVLDPFTGEKILVNNATANTNIKALYVDGRFELFSVRESDGSIQMFSRPDKDPTVVFGESAKVEVNHGYSNVYVLNNTDEDIVINGIENIRTDNSIYPALSIGNNVTGADGKITVTTQDQPIVNLQTKKQITVGGKVLNSYVRDANGNLNIDNISGGYVQVANFGPEGSVIIAKISDTEPSITSGGYVKVFNNQNGSIFVFGGIDSPSIMLSQPTKSDGGSFIDGIDVERIDVFTAGHNIDVGSTDVRVYGKFQTSDKVLEVDNEDISIKDNVGVKLFTGLSGAFSLNMNETNLVVTDAPVVYVRGNVVVKNSLGYHTFETLSYSEANIMGREAKTVAIGVPSFARSIISADVELVEVEED